MLTNLPFFVKCYLKKIDWHKEREREKAMMTHILNIPHIKPPKENVNKMVK